MDKGHRHIDFEIVWKNLHGISSEDDDKMLDLWLQDDKANRDFFIKAERYFHDNKITDETPVDIEAALRKVKHDAKRPKSMLMRVASIAATLLVASVISYLLFPVRGKVEVEPLVQAPSTSPSTIVPGKNKAVLIVDNGASYELSGEEDLSLDLDGVQVKGRGTQIEYVADVNEKTEELRYNTLSVPPGGEFFVILSDSTKVWLNSGTTMRYPLKFSGDERRIELEGEASFAVAHDAAKPFRVQSRGQVVEALGTEFNVTAYTDEDVVLTTLVEGKVKVSLLDEPYKYQVLLPGAQSRFLPETHEIEQYEVNVEEFISWKSGWFVFRDAPLMDMMKTLSRWYDVEVQFESESAGNIRFTGDIKRYDDLDKLLTVIGKTNEVNIRIEDKKVIIN